MPEVNRGFRKLHRSRRKKSGAVIRIDMGSRSDFSA
jgi:hypothetical protein